MSDKPNATTTATTRLPTLNPPPSKSHLYNPNRHPHRPNPAAGRRLKKTHRKCTCRRCCCLTFFWAVLVLLMILLLAAIAAAAFYALYRPQRPSFSVTAVKISTFNLTTTAIDDTTHLTTKINITLSAKNTNKRRITFVYDPMSIAVQSSSAAARVNLAGGAFENFTNAPDSINVIHTTMGVNAQLLDSDAVNSINSDLKKKNGLPMEIVMDTMVGVKLEKMKMRKIGIRVKCDNIHGMVPKGKNGTAVAANTSKAKCKVDLRIKIFKWTF